jgi:hypothetical protein
MRLLGAIWPKTLEGTIAGNPAAATAPAEVFKNARRETFVLAIARSLYALRSTTLAFFCALMTSSAASRHCS